MKNNNAFSADGATARHIVSDYRITAVRHCEERSDEAIHTKKTNRLLHYVRNDVKRAAFTLAEVLTTLVIIGVVAAITVPILQATISEHIMEKQQKVFERKFDQNLHVMQLKGELSKPYTSTMDFVDTMKKYMNITKVCDKDHLTDCFAPMIMQNKRYMKYDVSQLKVGTDVDIQFSDKYDSDLVGIVFADGVTALIAQDPKCIVADKYNQTADVSYCIGMIYDVNGTEGPNIIYQDILTMNVGTKAIEITMGEIFTPIALSIDNCEKAKKGGVPITYCEMDNDFYAGAADKCFQEGGRLPTPAEFNKIAERVYGQTISFSGETKGLTVKDQTLWAKLGSPDSEVIFWSSQEYSYIGTNRWTFSSSSTKGNMSGDRSNHTTKAFCIFDYADEAGK